MCHLCHLFVPFVFAGRRGAQNFGCLVRRKNGDAIDGVPLIVGCATVLKQFHPSYTRKFLAYLGQFVRSNIDFTLTREANKLNDVPFEVMNTIIFIEQFCMVGHCFGRVCRCSDESSILHGFSRRSHGLAGLAVAQTSLRFCMALSWSRLQEFREF